MLVILNDTNGTVWSSNNSTPVQNPIAQLLDSGNLVVRDAGDDGPDNFLWQSFDHPTNVFIPGMKFGWDLVTGTEIYITAWRSDDDASPGALSFHLDPTGYPQVFLKQGSKILSRMGPWDGINFSGGPNDFQNPMYRLIFVMNQKEVRYLEETIDKSFVTLVEINPGGVVQRWAWVNSTQTWRMYISFPADNCDTYGLCGAYGSCSIANSPLCTCMDRFVPKDPQGWAKADWNNGCVRRTNLSCQGDIFLKYSGIKLPDARYTWNNANMTLEECRAECLKDCSCMAYSQLDILKDIGCLMWYKELIDIKSMVSDGQDIYVRMASTEAEIVADPERKKRKTMLIAGFTSAMGIVLIGLSLSFYVRKRSIDLKIRAQGTDHAIQENNSEVPLFDLSSILKATGNFAIDNKLGEGGFGPVYKGVLEDGQEIAVKRLSKDSTQGLDEFRNEIIFIAKLQHRNLVRLIGGCIQGDENMLIYEYMPNKSLDMILFDQRKKLLLDWERRFNIINGIARGLLYLHQDSRLTIIHRDLKASNIVLDSDMNPRISDFGIARSFGGNETTAKTRRVIGTYGYMSPEYAIDGIFSVKSDVFSFGVLALEMVTGMSNRGFNHTDHNLNLLGHAWTLYKEGRSLELVDPCLETFNACEMLRTIHVSLLCVQQNPKDRPSMSTVVTMLTNEGFFPPPKQPGFFTEREVLASTSSTGTNAEISANEVTITLLEARMLQAKDILTPAQVLRDGDTMISSGGDFVLGFFSPGNSKNRYVGIWYNRIKVQTVAWVANRETPLTNTSGTFTLMETRFLAVIDGSNRVVWSTNSSKTVPNPVAQLLDTGNLVVKDANDPNPENFLWQSFDHPTDHLLPGMKLGWNYITGREVYLSSWKSYDDPSAGDYTIHCDPTGYPQLTIKNRDALTLRTGPWNGLGFSGVPNGRKNTIYSFEVVMNNNEIYYHFELLNHTVVSRYTLNESGVGQRWTWVDDTQGWVIYLTSPTDTCDTYGFCGVHGSCNIVNSPLCGCLDRFVPKDPIGWERTDWSKGCVRRTPLNCSKGDVFLKYSGIKLPDARGSWFNVSMTLEECGAFCLKNCSCTAYTILDIRNGGSGCLMWFGELVDIREVTQGEDIYIRMASSEIKSKGMKVKIMLILVLLGGIILVGLSLMLYFKKRKKTDQLASQARSVSLMSQKYESHEREIELPMFDLNSLTKATDNFSLRNKIGEGGFGPVYKGLLEGGKEIAVKCLSQTSLQGVDEFKNEVSCIAKLQHRNLVRLLGCCTQGEENMLVYEYMTNKSLDLILFDPVKSSVLDWPKRFHIINGIARGLMYLHQDSCLRIIHRDLKASNILLDSDMNPKISDFGLARIFGGNETGVNTNRVVGTYGYMSPEYTIDGIFSVKSDVYSYGVLVLEIVSGKRNRGFSHRDHQLNLLGHAWMLYKEGRALELMGSYPGISLCLSKIMRCIHIGLLCVQRYPEDRPSMSSVVLMLGNEGALPEPEQPGFFTEREVLKPETSFSSNVASSGNEVSITLLEPR
ncbi:hypothetical protein F511_21580 [Dorcoceras hygrometricum]|uniref:non-specific serine/threonine protein kinase n=1 Tax=Dorcoceras hygrometricum TaxID=472368 RepID=A0A2Z7D973_9LAMI|nr:hypothetical protein F511_21580 [Dorcoceras hygrometricum]